MHGYSIGQKVGELTDGEIKISPGTMYGNLSKMEKDGLIQFVRPFLYVFERCTPEDVVY